MGVFSKQTADGIQRKPAWHRDFKEDRRDLLKATGTCLLIVVIILYAIQSLYFGALYRQPANTYRLTVRVLDLDSQYAQQNPDAPDAILGPSIIQAIRNTQAARPDFTLGWQIASQAELDQLKLTQDGQGLNASDYARHLVTNQDVFGAVVIHPNATVLATEAAQQGIQTYDPRGAISFYYAESRNLFSVLLWVTRFTTDVLATGIAQASSQFASQFISTTNTTALTTAAPVIANPFGYSEFNLVPFQYLAAEPPTTAGTIYLIIFTFFITPVSRMTMMPLRQRLTFLSEMLLTVVLPLILWFWVSLCYSLVTLAFHVPMTIKFGHGGFPIFWALNWVTMAALGLVMENAFSLLGLMYFPFFLVCWVVWQVSIAFVDVADQDHFYSYAFVTPVFNAVDGSKCILLGTKNHLVQNFVVNLAWVVLAAITLMIITAYQRSKRLQGGPPPLPKAVEEKEASQKGSA